MRLGPEDGAAIAAWTWKTRPAPLRPRRWPNYRLFGRKNSLNSHISFHFHPQLPIPTRRGPIDGAAIAAWTWKTRPAPAWPRHEGGHQPNYRLFGRKFSQLSFIVAPFRRVCGDRGWTCRLFCGPPSANFWLGEGKCVNEFERIPVCNARLRRLSAGRGGAGLAPHHGWRTAF